MFQRVTLTILLFFVSVSFASAFQVPDTGITDCYDSVGNQINPCPELGQPYYGQDGNIIHNDMSYTENGNGTLTDDVTGLLWQKTSDANPLTWNEAASYCNNLTLGGHASGWRLPALVELDSIMNLSVHSEAAIDSAFTGTEAAGYWTSTEDPEDSAKTWILDFGTNEDYITFKAGSNYTRCVRTGVAP